MKQTAIQSVIFLVVSLFLSTTLLASNVSFLGIEGTGQGLITNHNASSKGKGSFIPAKSNGRPITFTPAAGNVKHLLPSGEARFDPHKDTANFTNFTSAQIVRDRVVRSNQINGGTCFGVSYFTCIYYSRLIRPIQQGKKANVFKMYDFDFGLWDGLTKDLSKAGSAPSDGVSYVVWEARKTEPQRHGNPLWNKDNMKNHLDGYRMRQMSSNHGQAMRIGAISHHLDQQTCDRVSFDATDGNELESTITELKKRIEEHGTQMFYWHHYNVSQSWYTWDKHAWGHACLFYRVSEFTVNGSNGTTRKALKFHVYDPNTNYTARGIGDTGEGYGNYMIYFPDSKQISFSQNMANTYGLHSYSSTVDNRQDKLGYYDIYEGHPVQKTIAKDAFCRGYTGLGRVLQAHEAQQARDKGKYKVD